MKIFFFLEGIPCIDGITKKEFNLRAHVLTWTGDIPALSKSLNLCGHNSYKGCRFCKIEGVYHQTNRHVYYPKSNSPLILRTHEETISIMNEIENEENKAIKDEKIKLNGNNILYLISLFI